MTLKESLFNKCVYKTTLRRFRLGSLIYFILLFLSGPLPLFTIGAERANLRYFLNRATVFAPERSVILGSDFMVFPTLFALFVPTVVALMVYNYVHSSKHGIFVHSTPVSRKANYFSSILGAFTLMWAPIIMTGIIYLIMGSTAYSNSIGVVAVFVWMLINIAITFIMFSVATLSAFLTGNGFALVAINVIIFALPPIVALACELFFNTFLFGFSSSAQFFSKIMQISPLVWIMGNLLDTENAYSFFKNADVIWFLVAAVLIYVATMFIYKARKIENCGEVAAFKIMRSVLKYTVSSFVFIISYGIFYQGIGMGMKTFLLIAAILCAVTYFGSEMIMQKNLRVWGKWKGLLGFYIGAGIVLSFVAFTSVFGFETYVPEANNVAEIFVYDGYFESDPYVKDEKVIADAVAIHESLTKDIPVIEREYTISDERYGMFFKYVLENGKKVERFYKVDKDTYRYIMGKMFESAEYKKAYTQFNTLNIQNITAAQLNTGGGNIWHNEMLYEDAKPLFEALEKDIENITFEECVKNYRLDFTLGIDATSEENERQNIFKKISGRQHYSFRRSITPVYKNAYNLLIQNGTYDKVKTRMSQSMKITKVPVNIKTEKFDNGYMISEKERALNAEELVSVNTEDAKMLFDTIAETETNENENGEFYLVFCSDEEQVFVHSAMLKIKKDEVPEYLKAYLQ